MTTVTADVCATPMVHVTGKDQPSASVRMLQIFAVCLMIFPGDDVLKVVGGDGYPAALVSYVIFFAWLAGSLLGQHNPIEYRYPVRITLAWLWIVSLASYILMNQASLNSEQVLSAQRWFLQLAGMSGIILVASEGLRSLEDIRRVLRALVWGGAFCGIVAGLQFKARIDLTKYLKLPGFSINAADSANAAIILRGGQNRVPGTATDPIELGVAAGMLLVLAVYLLMNDKDRPTWQRVVPVLCILVSVVGSVSRSGVIAVAVAFLVLVVSLPPVRRLKGLSAIPVALGAVFVVSHGLLGTLDSYFLAGGNDPSIAHRTNNYPYVEALIRQSPWLGQGGNTYIADATHILDDQYLTTAINLGLLGLAALAFYLAWPVLVAFVARRRTEDPETRELCAALGGASLAAVICAGTFDGFSFPMFFDLQALVAGLTGAVWIMVNETPSHEIREGGIIQ
jgi:O-antigen ligase